MAAATEDRLGAYINEPAGSLFHDKPLADGEVLYERTLVTLNGSGELEPVAGNEGSDAVVLCALKHQEDDGVIGNVERTRDGKPIARAFQGVIVGLDNDDGDTTGYSIGDPAYAVDDSTVSASDAGSNPTAGTVYDIRGDEILVRVDGILK